LLRSLESHFSKPGKSKLLEIIQALGMLMLFTSLADLGLDVTTIEKKFDAFFKLASNWGAVLLFDEADILLESRSTLGDLKRNSLVSSE
jgi:hypothetical protein